MGLRNQNNYLSKLTDNSVKNIDREPVGENCADICDKNGPLTLKIFQAEHGMSSLYSCTGQILCQVCMGPIMACVANLNSFMYGDIMYYVHHTPVFDMNHDNPENPRVQMGIAYVVFERYLFFSFHSLVSLLTHNSITYEILQLQILLDSKRRSTSTENVCL